MSYYKASLCSDPRSDVEETQIVVHWDDNDPNRFVVAPRAVRGHVTEEVLGHELAAMGFRVISTESDNVGRGWAIVQRSSPRTFYDPISEDWWTYLSDEQKAAIREKYPDAVAPGVQGGHR